jgi:hypothetical protein
MFGSQERWLKYLQSNFKLKVNNSDALVELQLVRHCLIHNNGRVSNELRKTIKKNRYVYNSIIIVTTVDMKRYRKAVLDICEKITQEVSINYKKA